ncbi:23S rRNA pseudouridine2605 synthase [Novosphingobium sp. PhB165]|nr:23S rRNA pseudouridine2605 synthase [Novosphingobium sp. PhB165]
MSKPPFKSGGPKRGGGGSRDGSPRGERGGGAGSRSNGPRSDGPRSDGPRSENRRGDAPRGDRPQFGRGPRKPAEGKSFGDKARERTFGERKSGEYRSDDRPSGDRYNRSRDDNGGGRSGGRSGSRGGERGDGRSGGAPRDGFPRGERGRSDNPRNNGPRSENPRSNGPRSDAPRSDRPVYGRGPRRPDDALSFGTKPSGSRSGEREGGERRFGDRKPGAYRSDDRPRGDRYRDERPSGDRYRDERRPRPPRPVSAAPRAAAPTAKTPGMPVREGERIAKLLARAGIASRREAERLIIEGRVKLGDEVIETPSTVLANLRGVTVDGNPVKDAEETRLFAFHKPAGLLTAERDPAGRPTIYTALRNALPEGAGRVMPIGRLDLNTEGLLLLTNDGEFKRRLELPATGVPRTYRARTFGDISQAQLEDLIEGIEVDGVIYGKIDANMERRTGRNQWIEMTLTEGKNREVRRVLEHLGLQVSRLIRTSYGPIRLLDLPKGMVIEISQRDLENFRKTLPVDKS